MAKTINERLLSFSISPDHYLVSWFDQYAGNFQSDSGSMPTPQMIAVAAMSCKKSPGVECVNVALAQRPEGVTVRQYLTVSGAQGAAHNHFKALHGGERGDIFAGIPKNTAVKCAVFTEKGEQWLAERLVSHGLKKAPKAAKQAPVKVKAKRNKVAAAVEAAVAAVEAAGEGDMVVAVEGVGDTTQSVTATDALQQLAEHFNS